MHDDYISKLDNKDKIFNISDKIVKNELKLHKYESKRLIIKKCIHEMENNLVQLQIKTSKSNGNKRINDEIGDTGNKIKEGHKALDKLNEKLSRGEVGLLKLRQDKRKEINRGLIKYLNMLNLKYEKLQQENNESNEDKENKEIEKEIEHIKRLIEIESNSS